MARAVRWLNPCCLLHGLSDYSALSSAELLVKRDGALPGHRGPRLGVHLLSSFRMNALGFLSDSVLKFLLGALCFLQSFKKKKNLSLPSAPLTSFSWHRTLADAVFLTHTEDLLTSPIRSLCQLISCFQTIYLFLSWLLFAGSHCLLFLAGSPTQSLGVKLFIFILFANFHSSLSFHAFLSAPEHFHCGLWMRLSTHPQHTSLLSSLLCLASCLVLEFCMFKLWFFSFNFQ